PITDAAATHSPEHECRCSTKTMAAQLRHLATMPPNVLVQILPATAGFPLGVSPGPFTILDFETDEDGEPVEPTVIYVESYAGDLYLEGTNSVTLYRQAHTTIRAAALDAADSRNMLRRLAKEFAP
ncbi:Scr1 family TA system antitoxin-like transcriptional regulator, partial [Nocardia seriolae]